MSHTVVGDVVAHCWRCGGSYCSWRCGEYSSYMYVCYCVNRFFTLSFSSSQSSKKKTIKNRFREFFFLVLLKINFSPAQ